ncbi:MAG: hypothetical protein ACFFAV_11455 [Candidatus Hermodarchaeota archaeon]
MLTNTCPRIVPQFVQTSLPATVLIHGLSQQCSCSKEISFGRTLFSEL